MTITLIANNGENNVNENQQWNDYDDNADKADEIIQL